MKCPGCKKQVDVRKEHVEVKKVMAEGSDITHHWHWKCWTATGRR